MRARRFSLWTAAVLAALFCPLASQGAILTFVMEGTVTGIGSDPAGLPNFAQMDDPVRFEFTFDSTAPNSSVVPGIGVYGAIGASLQIGNTVFDCATPRVEIQHPGDVFDVYTNALPVANTAYKSGISLFRLNDYEESNTLEGVALPLAPYDLCLFELPQFSVLLLGPPLVPGGYDARYQAYGDITAFYAVPEPFTLAFAGLGIVFCQSRGSSRPKN